MKLKQICCGILAAIIFYTCIPTIPQIQADAASSCVINIDNEYQTIQGFGGINHPEWCGDLNAEERQMAFGNGDNELGLMTLPIYEAPCLFWRLSFFTAPFIFL